MMQQLIECGLTCATDPHRIYLNWAYTEMTVVSLYVVACVYFICLHWISNNCCKKQDDDKFDLRKQGVDFLTYHRSDVQWHGLKVLMAVIPFTFLSGIKKMESINEHNFYNKE
jgi:hypothetical protein